MLAAEPAEIILTFWFYIKYISEEGRPSSLVFWWCLRLTHIPDTATRESPVCVWKERDVLLSYQNNMRVLNVKTFLKSQRSFCIFYALFYIIVIVKLDGDYKYFSLFIPFREVLSFSLSVEKLIAKWNEMKNELFMSDVSTSHILYCPRLQCLVKDLKGRDEEGRQGLNDFYRKQSERKDI